MVTKQKTNFLNPNNIKIIIQLIKKENEEENVRMSSFRVHTE